MDMQVENINWLVPPPRDASDVPAPAFTQPWGDPYSDILDIGPLDPSFTAALEDTIVDPSLLGGFEDVGKAVEADHSSTGTSAVHFSAAVKEEISTVTSPDLDFFSQPSISNRSSSLITPDSLPPALPSPPLLHSHPLQHAHPLSHPQTHVPQPQPKKRGRPQKRQSPQQQDKSPSKRKRKSPAQTQKPMPRGPSPPAIHPDLAAASSSASSSFASASSAASSTAFAGPSGELHPLEEEAADDMFPMNADEEYQDQDQDGDQGQGDGEDSAAQSKRSRIREKNRIAACKCRRKQRKAVSKLTSTHEGLEELNRRLCGQVTELEAEAYMLKNMLMAHGNCGCEMIQQYFRDAAANIVQKNDADVGGSSASRSRARTSETFRSAET